MNYLKKILMNLDTNLKKNNIIGKNSGYLFNYGKKENTNVTYLVIG